MTTQATGLPVQLTDQRRGAGIAALVIGLFLIFGVGLSHIAAAHNAAHDTRHAIGFPCH
ncbi:MAG: CbtB-domain containing protein [Rhizobiales bacterium]|nr:CbtB-domain containing protein [Hyphomicrobiales bacterium]